MRTLKALLLAVILAPAMAFGEAKLNLFIWSEYIDPKLIKEFQKQYDCKVNVSLYEDNESMLAKLEGGGDSLYDVVVPSDYIVPILIRKGLIAPLDKQRIPNFKNLDERFLNPPIDPGNTFTVPYQWGTMGIFMRKQPGKTIEESWSLFFDPSKQPGPFVMIDSMRDAMTMALKYKGHPANDTDREHLKEARDLLLESKKRSLGFEVAIGGRNRVLSKGAVMAIAYNGDAARSMKEDPDTYYFIPKEGSNMWLDSLAIPSKAPHLDLAQKFINFILEPEVGAQLSNFNQYATPNKASMPLIAAEDRANPAIYPNPAIMERLEFLKDLGADSRLYDEIWTQIKAE